MTEIEALEELARAWETHAAKVEKGIDAARRCHMVTVADDAHRVASTYRKCTRDLRAILRLMRAKPKKEPTT